MNQITNGSSWLRTGIDLGSIKPTHYRWIVLFLVLGAQVAENLLAVGIPVLYPMVQAEFGLSRAQVGLITSAFFAGGLFTVVPAGSLADSLGVRRVIAFALFSMTALSLTFPLASSHSVLLILTALLGIATSPIYPATTLAIMEWFPTRSRAMAMSIKQTGNPIAGAFSAAVIPALALTIGWRLAGASIGVLLLIIAVAFLLLYRDAPQTHATTHKLNLAAMKTLFHERSLLITAIWGAVFVGLQFIVATYFMLFLIGELKVSAIMAGGLLAIAQLSSVAGRVLWGVASDIIFRGRRVGALAITGFATVAWLLVISLVTVDTPMALVYLLAVVIGLTTLSFQGVFTVLVGELAQKGQVGTTMGLVFLILRICMVAMPPLFGYMVDISSYSVVWKITAAVALTLTLAFMMLAREPAAGE